VGRNCTVCSHDEAHVINVELVSRVPYRDVERAALRGREERPKAPLGGAHT
jgi:hypothetical protein